MSEFLFNELLLVRFTHEPKSSLTKNVSYIYFIVHVCRNHLYIINARGFSGEADLRTYTKFSILGQASSRITDE